MTRTIVRLAVCAAALAVPASAALTARPQRPSPSPVAAATARLAGRIVDAADARQPIRRAIVTITGDAIAAGRSVVSDDAGRFAFERVPAGVVTLTASRAGFVRATYGAIRAGRPGTPIAIRAGADVVDLTIAMTHGAALEGTLRDIAGDPAPGMRVEAIRVVARADGAHGETAAAVMTDDRGGFRAFGLLPGEYVLVATPAAIIAGIGDIGAPSEAELDAILASLPRKAPTTPKPANAPAPAVKAFSTPATFYPGVLQSGEATRVTLGAGEERTGLDFAVQLTHSAAIDGAILPIPGGSVPQVTVAIRGAVADLPIFGGMAGGPTISMRPAEHTFHISNVPPGRYRITARTVGGPGNTSQTMTAGGALPKGPDPNAAVQWAVTDVNIGGDDLTNIALALQPALRVSGRIAFDATTLRAPADASTMRVALEPIADAESGSSGLTSALPATIRADGTFEFPQVIPGAYRLTAATAGAGANGWWLRSALLDTRDVMDGGIRVGVTDVSGVALTFADRHSGIAGTLSSTTGQPAPAYVIVAFPTDRSMWRAPSRRVRLTRPATDGSFSLLDLPPGAYYVVALTDVDASDLDDAAFLDQLVRSSVTVSFGEGEQKRQDFKIGG